MRTSVLVVALDRWAAGDYHRGSGYGRLGWLGTGCTMRGTTGPSVWAEQAFIIHSLRHLPKRIAALPPKISRASSFNLELVHLTTRDRNQDVDTLGASKSEV